jgi:L-amino acid N-acyltransferase YncA
MTWARQTSHTFSHFLVKISATNAPSIGLFRKLGFEQDGEVDVFGEVTMLLAR